MQDGRLRNGGFRGTDSKMACGRRRRYRVPYDGAFRPCVRLFFRNRHVIQQSLPEVRVLLSVYVDTSYRRRPYWSC